jgi:muconolactone D-isomerase
VTTSAGRRGACNRERRKQVEFLVHIQVNWPGEADPDELARLTADERRRAKELVELGRIRRLWRIPGRRANWGLWQAADATELHEAISSLPLFPWLSVEVHPLAAHPSDPETPSS